jgi:hypothetical protein
MDNVLKIEIQDTFTRVVFKLKSRLEGISEREREREIDMKLKFKGGSHVFD